MAGTRRWLVAVPRYPAVFPASPYLPGQGNRDDRDGLRAVRLAVMGSRRASPLAVAARKRTDRLALAQEHGEAGFGGQALQSVCAEAPAGP